MTCMSMKKLILSSRILITVFDSRSYPYLRRRVNQLIAQKRLKMPTIPLSVDEAKVHEHAKGFMSALDEEVSSLWNMST